MAECNTGALVGEWHHRVSIGAAFPSDRLGWRFGLWHVFSEHRHSQPGAGIYGRHRIDLGRHLATPFGLPETGGFCTGANSWDRRFDGLRHAGTQRFPRSFPAELGSIAGKELDV